MLPENRRALSQPIWSPSVDFATFGNSRYFNVPSYQRGVWDGYIRMTRKVKDGVRFPAGLLSLVLAEPWAQGAEVLDLRVRPPIQRGPHHAGKPLVDLVDEQEALISMALEAEQGILQVPTGVGKGRIMGTCCTTWPTKSRRV
jgi:hypothetical protein